MSKFSSFAEYPPRSLVGAEAALLTAWASYGQAGIDDRRLRERQIVEQLVTIGRALVGEG